MNKTMNTSPIITQPHPSPATSVSGRVFLGIDNGFTGAMACLLSDGTARFAPVQVIDLGKERLLDIDANRAVLHQLLEGFSGPRYHLLAAYEQCQPNPLFGARNNFSNGKNGEFWRLLLSQEGIPFRPVNPQQWQKYMFRGLRGDDTKVMADLVRRQRLPSVKIDGFNKIQKEGINDALCIAIWASELSSGPALALPDSTGNSGQTI